MAKRITLSKYDQTLVDMAQMPVEQLEQIGRVAKVLLAQKKPRVRKASVKAKPAEIKSA